MTMREIREIYTKISELKPTGKYTQFDINALKFMFNELIQKRVVITTFSNIAKFFEQCGCRVKKVQAINYEVRV